MRQSQPESTVCGLKLRAFCASKRAVLTQAFNDATNAIMFGRAPLSTFDDAVKAWRSSGGDQMRREYEDAYAAAR